MGVIRINEDYLVKGINRETGETVYGNFVQMLIDSEERAYIYPFPENPNTGNHAYTPDPVECDPDSIHRYTGVSDGNGIRIYEGDRAVLPNEQRGTVVMEAGTWGIGVAGLIDWDGLCEKLPSYRSPHFLYNDNFISFYELFDNFCPEEYVDGCLTAIEIL